VPSHRSAQACSQAIAPSAVEPEYARTVLQLDRAPEGIKGDKRSIVVALNTAWELSVAEGGMPNRRRQDHLDIVVRCGRNACGSESSTLVILVESSHLP